MRPYRPLPLIWVAVLFTGLVPGCSGPAAPAPEQPAAPSAVVDSRPPTIDHPNLPIAARLLRSGQFLDAEIVLRTVLRESPDCARAKFLLGVAVMKQKRYAQARDLLEGSLASRQDFPDAVQVDHFLGWTCYYLGDLDAAKRAFQAHVHAVPTAADSYFGLGVVAIDEDRISDAEQALRRSMELLPPPPHGNRDRAKALARLGDCALRRDHADEALALYEESSQVFADHAEVWGKLAHAYEQAGRVDDAKAARVRQDSLASPPVGQQVSP